MQVQGGTGGEQVGGGTAVNSRRVDVEGNTGNPSTANPSGGNPGTANPGGGIPGGTNPGGGVPGGTNPGVGVSPGRTPTVDDRIFGVSADVLILISLFIAVVALVLSLRALSGLKRNTPEF